MRKFKVNIRMKLCRTGLVLEMVCFGLAIATVINPRFWPILTFSLVDFCLIHFLAFYFEVKEVSE